MDHNQNTESHEVEEVFCSANTRHKLMRLMPYRLLKVTVENISLDDATEFELVTTFHNYVPGSHPSYPSNSLIVGKDGLPSEVFPIPEVPGVGGLVVRETSAYTMTDTLQDILEEIKTSNFHLAQISGVTDFDKEDI